MTKRINKRYSEAEIQRALVEVAAQSGNTRRASQKLSEEGLEVPHQTLVVWKNRIHADDYQRVRTEMLPALRERAADLHASQEELDLALSQAATQRLIAELPFMEHKDLINAKGKADIGTGIHGEKRLLFDGQPTVRVQRQSGEIIRELQAEGMDFIEGRVVGEEDVVDAVAVGSGSDDEVAVPAAQPVLAD